MVLEYSGVQEFITNSSSLTVTEGVGQKPHYTVKHTHTHTNVTVDGVVMPTADVTAGFITDGPRLASLCVCVCLYL